MLKMSHVGTLAAVFSVLALIGTGCSNRASKPAVPGASTARAIVSALHRQETARGSIEVTYTYSRPGHPRTMRGHYIRSGHEVLLRYGHSVLSASFDKSTGEYREMIVTSKSTHGVIPNRPSSVLRSIMVPDPIRKPFSVDKPVDLVDVLETGEVVGPMRSIDGHPCWPVSVDPVEDYTDRRVLWLDPKIGFLPRRAEFIHTRRPGKFSHWSSYKALAPGVWFPMRISGGSLGGAEDYVIDITDVHIGRKFAKGSILIHFPPGTRVEDQVAKRTYTVP